MVEMLLVHVSSIRNRGIRAFWAWKVAHKKSMKFTRFIVFYCWKVNWCRNWYGWINKESFLLKTESLILLLISGLSKGIFGGEAHISDIPSCISLAFSHIFLEFLSLVSRQDQRRYFGIFLRFILNSSIHISV